MKIRRFLSTAIVAVTCLAFSNVASASIFLTPVGLGDNDGSIMANALGEIASGNQGPGTPAVEAAIANLLGITVSELQAIEQYRSNVSGLDEKTFASSYTTTYANTPSDPSEFTISWDGPPDPFISGATHLLVKDGNANPVWYLFDITGIWDGMADIVGFNFWPNQGSISHVSIYGGGPPPPGNGEGVIPEPTMLVVWSLLIGTVGLLATRRRRSTM